MDSLSLHRLAALALAILLGGCAPGALLLPARPAPGADSVRAELEARGSRLTPALFADSATLELWDTILESDALKDYLTGAAESRAAVQPITFEGHELYVCPDGAVQVGRYTTSQRLPGSTAPTPIAGDWLARWERSDSGWVIHEAALRPSLLRTTRLGIDPECVGPSERRVAARPVHVSAHWGGVWSRGGPNPGLEAELQFNGWQNVSSSESAFAIGAARRFTGSWGGRLLLAHRSSSGRATTSTTDEIELRGTATTAAALLMHERWLVRAGTGPAVTRSGWTWSGPDGSESAEWSVGWVNELAIAIPVRGSFFLDFAYHDWLMRPSAPPAHFGASLPELRLRGSSLSVGIGRRF